VGQLVHDCASYRQPAEPGVEDANRSIGISHHERSAYKHWTS
jgi:hypothetical protein